MGIYFTPNSELSVVELSATEKAWIRRLHKVLSEAPERIALLTIGDDDVSVIDGKAAKGCDLHDGKASSNGIVLASVGSKAIIHGVSG